MSLNFLATRFQCSWPWSTLVMLCDGRHRLRLRRSLRQTRARRCQRGPSVHEIWTGPVVSGVRADLNAGGSKFCGDCPLKLPLKKDEAPPVRPLDAGPQPSRMYIECTAACNISCTEACCAPETGITRTRAGRHARLRSVPPRRRRGRRRRSVRIDFFNYGEAFLHKRAVEMCEVHQVATFPHIYLYTSTNGLALDRSAGAPARALGHRRGDVLDRRRDARKATCKYRQRGRFDLAIANLRAHGRREARGGPRCAVPQLALHPLQLERQRRGDGARARSWPPRSASIASAGR